LKFVSNCIIQNNFWIQKYISEIIQYVIHLHIFEFYITQSKLELFL